MGLLALPSFIYAHLYLASYSTAYLNKGNGLNF